MKIGLSPMLFAVALAFAIPVIAQESVDVSDSEAPILPFEHPPDIDSLGIVSQQPAAPTPPAVQNTAADMAAEEYRGVIQRLSEHRHQYVHLKLKNGKVLTGLLRDVGDHGFSLSTDALGGPYISYKEIAEKPRPTPGVGTRIKQGAEWTGLVALVIAATPIMLPLILTGVISDC